MTEATLKVATFLVPSVSVEFFESLQSYLEQKLSCHSILRYESRFESPQDIFNESTSCDIGKWNERMLMNNTPVTL